MSTQPTITEWHQPSFRGLFFILKRRNTFSKWPFKVALFLAVVIFSLFMYLGTKSSFDALNVTVDLILSFFPNLLGFSLGGFAIVVGFTNTDLIKESTKENTYSVYQLLNSIFALCIIFQVGIVLIAYFLSWIIELKLLSWTMSCNALPTFLNSLFLLILNFGAIYSLLLTPFIVINLFTLSQTNNLFYTILKIKEKATVTKQEPK